MALALPIFQPSRRDYLVVEAPDRSDIYIHVDRCRYDLLVFEAVILAVESFKVFLEFKWVLGMDWLDGITCVVKICAKGPGYCRNETDNDRRRLTSQTHPSEIT